MQAHLLLCSSTFPANPNGTSSPTRRLTSTPICISQLRRQREPSLKTPWPSISLSLFGSGFLLGPLIDGLHSRVNLVSYQSGSVDIGPLHTNIWVCAPILLDMLVSAAIFHVFCYLQVPFLLGLFYTTIGIFQLILDERSPTNAPRGSLSETIASLVALVVFIELSAELYKAGVADNIEAYILFAGAELIWLLVDRTRLGFALACFVGIACPLAEIPIMNYFDLWYYPKANVEILGQGLVSWTLTCYFVYTPFLINLSRWLRSVFEDIDMKDDPETDMAERR